MTYTPTEQLVAAGINPKAAAEILRQVGKGDSALAVEMYDAGVDTTLAIILEEEIRDAAQPMLAGRAAGRKARFLRLELSDEEATALTDAIGTVKVHT
jgi:hypothetical protein